MGVSNLPELYRQLAGSFEDAPLEAPPGALTLEEVKDFVKTHVERLLDTNPGLLMSILYRIDVAEADVQEVMRSARVDEIADHLADLIVRRQLQKLELRRKYSD